MAGPESANNLLKALRIILDFAVGRGIITNNPTHGLKRFKSANRDGHHSWSEDEIRQYEAKHPLDTRAGLALALLVYTGQRRGDVLRMGLQHIRGDCIVIRQQKTGMEVSLPITAARARARSIAENKADVPRHLMGRSFFVRRVQPLVLQDVSRGWATSKLHTARATEGGRPPAGRGWVLRETDRGVPGA